LEKIIGRELKVAECTAVRTKVFVEDFNFLVKSSCHMLKRLRNRA